MGAKIPGLLAGVDALKKGVLGLSNLKDEGAETGLMSSKVLVQLTIITSQLYRASELLSEGIVGLNIDDYSRPSEYEKKEVPKQVTQLRIRTRAPSGTPTFVQDDDQPSSPLAIAYFETDSPLGRGSTRSHRDMSAAVHKRWQTLCRGVRKKMIQNHLRQAFKNMAHEAKNSRYAPLQAITFGAGKQSAPAKSRKASQREEASSRETTTSSSRVGRTQSRKVSLKQKSSSRRRPGNAAGNPNDADAFEPVVFNPESSGPLRPTTGGRREGGNADRSTSNTHSSSSSSVEAHEEGNDSDVSDEEEEEEDNTEKKTEADLQQVLDSYSSVDLMSGGESLSSELRHAKQLQLLQSYHEQRIQAINDFYQRKLRQAMQQQRRKSALPLHPQIRKQSSSTKSEQPLWDKEHVKMHEVVFQTPHDEIKLRSVQKRRHSGTTAVITH